METQVRTPQSVFNLPQRLMVPLFQRPYIWNEDNQWEPLWADVARVAQRAYANPQAKQKPHFFGAIVLQQLQNPLGTMQVRTIIDGQQRLTTLQLLFDALHRELQVLGAQQPARRLETLVKNDQAFWEHEHPIDRFKVWPTNRDRPAFQEIMTASRPLNYNTLKHKTSRLVKAHEYFGQRAREWLVADKGKLLERATAVERTVRDLIEMVVIELTAEENAQEIFETLNARGAQLTAADLIKNFIFQRLTEDGADVEAAYDSYWRDFETGFWETEISAGRVKLQRSSVFLDQWLIAKTGEEILAREVFYKFKTYAVYEADVDMVKLLEQIHRAGQVYQDFVSSASQLHGPVDRRGLFAYRTSVMESEVIKPLVLFLYDPDDTPIPDFQLKKALEVIESWLVRRMLVRATSKSYAQVVAELIAHVRKTGREAAGNVIEGYLRKQNALNWYWPDNKQVKAELRTLTLYRRLSRARARMVLETIEDYERGWKGDAIGLGGERVPRGSYTIEHILPRRWHTHWPPPTSVQPEERDALVDTLGNLTLLTGKLNTKISNGPWHGPEGKQKALEKHDVLVLNRKLLKQAEKGWHDETIRARGEQLIGTLIDIWKVPDDHVVATTRVGSHPVRKVELADLIGAGMIDEGATLHAPAGGKFGGRTATVLPDGTLDVNGEIKKSPSGAARLVTKTPVNGWAFWLVDLKAKRSLKDLVQEYLEQRDMDFDFGLEVEDEG
jgi:hypothetical protein